MGVLHYLAPHHIQPLEVSKVRPHLLWGVDDTGYKLSYDKGLHLGIEAWMGLGRQRCLFQARWKISTIPLWFTCRVLSASNKESENSAPKHSSEYGYMDHCRTTRIPLYIWHSSLFPGIWKRSKLSRSCNLQWI